MFNQGRARNGIQDLFGAEDMVGQIKKVAKQTHKKTTALRVAQRRMLLCRVRWRHGKKSVVSKTVSANVGENKCEKCSINATRI